LQDRNRIAKEKITDLEEEERVKREVHVEKARDYLNEAEDEMKALNTVRRFYYKNV